MSDTNRIQEDAPARPILGHSVWDNAQEAHNLQDTVRLPCARISWHNQFGKDTKLRALTLVAVEVKFFLPASGLLDWKRESV